mmetsp:Transcript_6051/g.11689  ORF Transcript_6051/g.11689 Transcript_6051/m.11689 type:complete len:212 (+) Transcript_6051:336-971(+)
MLASFTLRSTSSRSACSASSSSASGARSRSPWSTSSRASTGTCSRCSSRPVRSRLGARVPCLGCLVHRWPTSLACGGSSGISSARCSCSRSECPSSSSCSSPPRQESTCAPIWGASSPATWWAWPSSRTCGLRGACGRSMESMSRLASQASRLCLPSSTCGTTPNSATARARGYSMTPNAVFILLMECSEGEPLRCESELVTQYYTLAPYP